MNDFILNSTCICLQDTTSAMAAQITPYPILISSGRSETDPDDPPLPSGWERHSNGNGGFYYFDHNTRTTSWARPLINHKGELIFIVKPFKDEEGWLPSGWEVRTNAAGRKYYIDHNTRTTTWDRA
jgi:hypothetical protein